MKGVRNVVEHETTVESGSEGSEHEDAHEDRLSLVEQMLENLKRGELKNSRTTAAKIRTPINNSDDEDVDGISEKIVSLDQEGRRILDGLPTQKDIEKAIKENKRDAAYHQGRLGTKDDLDGWRNKKIAEHENAADAFEKLLQALKDIPNWRNSVLDELDLARRERKKGKKSIGNLREELARVRGQAASAGLGTLSSSKVSGGTQTTDPAETVEVTDQRKDLLLGKAISEAETQTAEAMGLRVVEVVPHWLNVVVSTLAFPGSILLQLWRGALSFFGYGESESWWFYLFNSRNRR